MLTRFSVSIEDDLLKKFDALVRQEGYPTRSEAVKALVRNALVEQDWQQEGEVAATISMVYNHHKNNLVNRLLKIQHDFGDAVLTSQHIHIDHDNCMEVLIVKGGVSQVKELARQLKSVKGIKHCELSTTTTGKKV